MARRPSYWTVLLNILILYDLQDRLLSEKKQCTRSIDQCIKNVTFKERDKKCIYIHMNSHKTTEKINSNDYLLDKRNRVWAWNESETSQSVLFNII